MPHSYQLAKAMPCHARLGQEFVGMVPDYALPIWSVSPCRSESDDETMFWISDYCYEKVAVVCPGRDELRNFSGKVLTKILTPGEATKFGLLYQ